MASQQILQINRNFAVCAVISALISATFSQLMSSYESHYNATITIVIGYVAFFGIFGVLFYLDNRDRYRHMTSLSIRTELIKLVTSFGIGEIFYITVRWISLFYLLESDQEPFVASLLSEAASTGLYMLVVSLFLKATKAFKNDL